jgi:hypothetical protein
LDPFQTQLKSVNLSGAIRVNTKYTSGKLVVPQEMKLEEVDGVLWIKYRLPVGGKAKNPNGALEHFLTLANDNTTGDHWLKFAQEWGVLCLCRHNLIASHDPRCFPRCDEPYYSDALAWLSDGKDFLEKIASKLSFANYEEIWFREPLSIWHQYARQMKALIRIFRILRGDERSNTIDEWNILRQIEMPSGNYGAQSVVQQFEIVAGIPIQRMPLADQCWVLGTILSMWIGESRLIPRLEWNIPGPKTPFSDLSAQMTLNSSYSDVDLFRSDHLTLFSVLVAQCSTAFGPDPFFKQCNCIGCSAHKGNCQELIKVSIERGRPPVYCDLCKPYNRQQQKNAWRKKNKKERSNQNE